MNRSGQAWNTDVKLLCLCLCSLKHCPPPLHAALSLGLPAYIHPKLIDPPALAGGLCVYLCTPRADFLRGRFLSALWDLGELEDRKEEIEERNLLKFCLAM